MWVEKVVNQFDAGWVMWPLLSPHPGPCPYIFKVKFWNCCISEIGRPYDLERKGCELIVLASIQPFRRILWIVSLTNLLEANKIARFYEFLAKSNGGWMYQIVTRVTSDIGVLSPHQVHWSLNQMATILQTFSIAFFKNKFWDFDSNFTEICSPRI